MADIVLVKGEEITLSTTPNTVNNASLVRVFNAANTMTVVTVKDADENVKGSFTVAGYDVGLGIEFIRKDFTDTIEISSNTNVKATSVGYY